MTSVSPATRLTKSRRRAGGRVAGDDDELAFLRSQHLHGCKCEVPDFFFGTLSLREVSLVGEVEQVFSGQQPVQFPENRQAAHARIEHPDW